MPNIHSEIVHLPGAATQGAKKAKQATPGWAKRQLWNRTSKPAHKATSKGRKAKKDYFTSNKFGTLSENQKATRTINRYGRAEAALTGASVGSLAAVPMAVGSEERHKQITRNQAAISRNKKKLVQKSRPTVHLITDLGTQATKHTKDLTSAQKWKTAGVGAAVVPAATTPLYLHNRKQQKGTLRRQEATLKQQRAQLRKRLMSDAEIRRRKKLQGHISQTTSTLGLGGLGVTGAAALAARKPGALRAVKKVPGLRNTTPEKMKNTAINTGIVSGGIGGVGGYNFAAYTNAESRKRKATVTKRMEMGYFGEEGHPVKLPEIKGEIQKDWSPVASNYSPERSRQKRNKAYESGALVGAGAAGAYTAHHGAQAVGQAKKLKVIPQASQLRAVKTKSGGTLHARHGKAFSAIDWGVAKPALKHGGKAAAGVAAVGAAAAGHKALKRKQKGSWEPYAKSAWGIDHH